MKEAGVELDPTVPARAAVFGRKDDNSIEDTYIRLVDGAGDSDVPWSFMIFESHIKMGVSVYRTAKLCAGSSRVLSTFEGTLS